MNTSLSHVGLITYESMKILRYFILLAAIMPCNCMAGQVMHLTETESPLNKPKNFVLLYSIDGAVKECKELAVSNDWYCIHVNIEGVDLTDAWEKHLVKVKDPRCRRYEEEARYFSYSDGRIYGPMTHYTDGSVSGEYMYFSLKTKLPMIINDTLYHSYRKKKKAVRQFKYTQYSIEKIEGSQAVRLYGRKAKNGVIFIRIIQEN